MQGGIPVLKTAMCGQWGPHCNPERLFEYIGSGPPKGPAPFTINYNIWDEANIDKATAALIYPLNDAIDSCEKGVLVSEESVLKLIFSMTWIRSISLLVIHK